MIDVVIASAARTAIGSYGKSLAGVPPSDLGAAASVAAIERAEIEREIGHARRQDAARGAAGQIALKDMAL